MAQLIDPRKPRDLTDAVDLVNPPKPFLITNVFKDERQHTVNTFDYAIEAGNQKCDRNHHCPDRNDLHFR